MIVLLLLALLGVDVPNYLPPLSVPGALNPDITQATISQTLCNPHWSTKSIRPPAMFTNRLKLQAMKDLGYTVKNPLPMVPTKNGNGTRPDLTKCVSRSATPACWEWDHREPIEAGGAPMDPANMWAQPWFGKWNAHLKDVLEDTIKRRICDGTMTLAEGQAVFLAPDWTVEYQRFVMPKAATRRTSTNGR